MSFFSAQYIVRHCGAVVSFTKPGQREEIIYSSLLHWGEEARTNKTHPNAGGKNLKNRKGTKLTCTAQALCFPGLSTRPPQSGEKQALRGTLWSILLSVLSQHSESWGGVDVALVLGVLHQRRRAPPPSDQYGRRLSDWASLELRGGRNCDGWKGWAIFCK